MIITRKPKGKKRRPRDYYKAVDMIDDRRYAYKESRRSPKIAPIVGNKVKDVSNLLEFSKLEDLEIRKMDTDIKRLEAVSTLRRLRDSREYRREIIAEYLSQSFTAREITKALRKDHEMKTRHGNPVSLAVVLNDIRHIRKEWADRNAATVAEHQSRQLSELNAIKRQGWKASEMDIVLKAISQETAILGTKKQVEATPRNEVTIKNEYTQVNLLTESDRNSRIMEILNKGRARAAGELIEGESSVEASS